MMLRNWLVLTSAIVLAGCAGYGANLRPGQSVLNDVEREMGRPTLVRELPNGERELWYSKLPYGRENYVARVAPDYKLLSFEQRLTREHIQKIVPKQSRAEDVLAILGPPWRKSDMPLKKREVWDYPLLTSPELQTLFIEFSPEGVVQELYQLHDRDRGSGFFFGLGGFGFGL